MKFKNMAPLISVGVLSSVMAVGVVTHPGIDLVQTEAANGEAFSGIGGIDGYFGDDGITAYLESGTLTADMSDLSTELVDRGIKRIVITGEVNLSDSVTFSSLSPDLEEILGLEKVNLQGVSILKDTFANLPELRKLEGLSGWNVSEVKEVTNIFANLPKLESLTISNWDLKGIEEGKAEIFTNTKDTLLSIENWKVYKVGKMFSGSEIESVDLSTWDTSELGNAGNLFASSKVKKINIRGMNFSKTPELGNLLSGNSVLEEIDVTGANIVGVEGASVLFLGKKGKDGEGLILKGLDTWDFSTVKYINAIFSGARINNLSLPNWDLSGVKNLGAAFRQFTGDNLNLQGLTINNTEVELSSFFSGAHLTNSNLSNWALDVKTMNSTFADATLENVDMYGLKVSAQGWFNSVFDRATISNSDLHGWEATGTRNANHFEGATLSDVNISSWKMTATNTNESNGYFFFKTKGNNLDLSNWVTDECTSYSFFNAELDNVDLASWAPIGEVKFVFSGAKIDALDLSSWNVENATSMSYVFGGTLSNSISIAGWTPKKMTDFYLPFSSSNVKYIDVTNLDLTKVEAPLAQLSTFLTANKVEKIKGINTIKINGGLSTHSFGSSPFILSPSLTQGVDLTSWGLSTFPSNFMVNTPSLYVTGYAPISHETVSAPLSGNSKLQFVDFPEMTASEGSNLPLIPESNSLVYLNLGDFRPTNWKAIGIVAKPGGLPNLKYLHLRNLDLGVLPIDVYTDGMLNFPNLLELEVGPDFKEKRGSDSWGLKGNWMLAGHPETLTTDPEGDTLADNPGLWIREGHTPTTTTVIFESVDNPDGTPAANEEFELFKDGISLGKYTTTNAGEFIDRLSPGDYEVRSTSEESIGIKRFSISAEIPPNHLKIKLDLKPFVDPVGTGDLELTIPQGDKVTKEREVEIEYGARNGVSITAQVKDIPSGVSLTLNGQELGAVPSVVGALPPVSTITTFKWQSEFIARATGDAPISELESEITMRYTVNL